MVNMALSQLFWDVLMPWNLKSTYFSLKMIHFLSLNIWYVIYVVFWIKYWNLKLPHHCILFLFTICTVSQLFWNRVCKTYLHAVEIQMGKQLTTSAALKTFYIYIYSFSRRFYPKWLTIGEYIEWFILKRQIDTGRARNTKFQALFK